ncbi:hypothetical protein WJX73_010369 [Symbiochloris irregularis]|uniref:Uncharacterized protein n=1 Tax=Symbiochloris irregularis TaxID=706552 RepID=A0AAW1PEK1_9CHLO
MAESCFAQSIMQPATLGQLCPADKQKVANLIRQVVTLGQQQEEVKAKQRQDAGLHSQRLKLLKESHRKVAQENESVRDKLGQALVLLRAYQQKLESAGHRTSARDGRTQHQQQSLLAMWQRQYEDQGHLNAVAPGTNKMQLFPGRMESTSTLQALGSGMATEEDNDWEAASQHSLASTHCTGSLLDLVAEVEELLLHQPPSR